jgi:hypothetical protein
MEEDQRKQVHSLLIKIIFVNMIIGFDSDIVLSFRRINHMVLKTICIDPLFTVAEHHVDVANNNNL